MGEKKYRVQQYGKKADLVHNVHEGFPIEPTDRGRCCV